MSKKNTTVPGRVAGFLGENSYIIVFVAIFIVYALTTNGLTWSGMMNVFRHSAVSVSLVLVWDLSVSQAKSTFL